jgi:hypothetical protein
VSRKGEGASIELNALTSPLLASYVIPSEAEGPRIFLATSQPTQPRINRDV